MGASQRPQSASRASAFDAYSSRQKDGLRAQQDTLKASSQLRRGGVSALLASPAVQGFGGGLPQLWPVVGFSSQNCSQ